MKKILSFGIGVSLLGGVSIVPSEMELAYSYQYHATDVLENIITGENAAEKVSKLKEVRKNLKDDDGNNIISVSVFRDKKGNEVHVQIPDERYSEMGKTGGSSKNPKKYEFESIFNSLTEEAEAAIAFDAVSASSVSGTSLTFAHTVTGANPYLACGVANQNNVDDVTGTTYNGIAMTQLQLATPDAFTVSHQYLFGLAGPSTGANNVVVSRSASGGIAAVCMSYTDVAQISTPNNSGKEQSPASATSHTYSATTTASNAWAVTFYGWQRAPTASTGITERGTAAGAGYSGGDSNGVVTSPHSFRYTYASCAPLGCDSAVWLVLAEFVAAAPSSPQDLIFIGDE